MSSCLKKSSKQEALCRPSQRFAWSFSAECQRILAQSRLLSLSLALWHRAAQLGMLSQAAGVCLPACWRAIVSVALCLRSWYPASYLYRRSGDLHCLGFESNGAPHETAANLRLVAGWTATCKTMGFVQLRCDSFSYQSLHRHTG